MANQARQSSASLQGEDKYPAVTFERGGQYFLICRPLGIVIKATNLPEAWTSFTKKREEILHLYDEAGIALPSSYEFVDRPRANAGGSMVKTAGVISVITVFLIILSFPIANFILTSKAAVRSITTSLTTPHNLALAAQNMAEKFQHITPERREEVVEALHQITVALEPFAAELRPLIIGPDMQDDSLNRQNKGGANNSREVK